MLRCVGDDRDQTGIEVALHNFGVDLGHDSSFLLSEHLIDKWLGERLAGEIIDALDQQTVTVVGTNAATIVLPQLARMLADIRESRDTVFAQVEALVEAHPLHPVLRLSRRSASGPQHRSSPRSSGKTSRPQGTWLPTQAWPR